MTNWKLIVNAMHMGAAKYRNIATEQNIQIKKIQDETALIDEKCEAEIAVIRQKYDSERNYNYSMINWRENFSKKCNARAKKINDIITGIRRKEKILFNDDDVYDDIYDDEDDIINQIDDYHVPDDDYLDEDDDDEDSSLTNIEYLPNGQTLSEVLDVISVEYTTEPEGKKS